MNIFIENTSGNKDTLLHFNKKLPIWNKDSKFIKRNNLHFVARTVGEKINHNCIILIWIEYTSNMVTQIIKNKLALNRIKKLQKC